MARFDVRGPATSCLKLGDERTQRRHRESDAFDPSLPSAANFCCDAQLCPLVGFVLDGQFCMRRRKFIAFLGSAQQSEGVRRIGFLHD